MIDLFETVVAEEKLDPTFKVVRDSPVYPSAKAMINEIYNSWDGFDQDFINQFQSTNFNARLWELYLFKVLDSLGFEFLENKSERPDFKLKKDGKIFFIEAVTSNPTGIGSENDVIYNTFNVESEKDYIQKIGSALFSKLNRKNKYWDLPWVEGHPVIFAIEPFHSSEGINVMDFTIIKYLYGISIHKYFNENGELVINQTKSDTHQIAGKEIPNYYDQEDAKNIAGVLFCGSATMGKFSRMGFQKGYGKDEVLSLFYQGSCHNHDKNQLDIGPFCQEIKPDGAGFQDEWRFGLNYFHNPNAKIPLGFDTFKDIAQGRYNQDCVERKIPCFHPYNGKNLRSIVYKSEEELKSILENGKPIDWEEINMKTPDEMEISKKEDNMI